MKLLNKFISLLLIQTFILSNIVYAAPIDKTSSAKAPKEITTDPEKVVIPREFGLIKSKFTGKGDRLLIHIQDAHCNFEAQSNIVKILENLSNNYSVNLISVEGADGVIDTTWFKAFPDDEVRKEVATYFMKKGEITGPEFLSITTDYPIKLFGAETRSYYIENLNAFTASYPLKDQTEKYFNNIKSALNRLKGFIYSEELKAMDEKVLSYESKKMQFNDYVRFLQDMAEKHKINLRQYDNFFKLVSALIYEKKIDFNVTDKERSALIDELSKKLSKDALTELVNQSIAFKVGKLSSAEYYSYLRKLAHDKEIDMYKTYPNLYNYIIYNAVYSRIENEELFNDIKKLEIAIKEKLFKNDDQRTLEKLSRHIDILIGLINIRLLNGDFDYYKANKESFSYEVFSDFIKKKTIQYGLAYEIDNPTDAVAKSIEDLESFYKIAIKRDNALVDNTFNQMRKDKERVAVLVTGGFHSEGITKILEKQKVSYMVICPNITKDVPSPYIQILTNQRTPLEEILVNSPTPEPKHGMLAPFSIAEAVSLRQDQLEKLSAMIRGAQTLRDRAYGFEEDFVKRHVERWLEKAIRYAQSHQYRYDINIMKRAYEIAMRNTLDRNIQEKGRIDGIMSQLLPAVMVEFDNIFERMNREVVISAGAIEVTREEKLRDYIEDILDAIDKADVSTREDVRRIVVRMLVAIEENSLAHKIELIHRKVGEERDANRISTEIRKQTVSLSDIEIDIIRIAILGPGEGARRARDGHDITMAESYLSPRNFRDYNLAKIRDFLREDIALRSMVESYWKLEPENADGRKTLAARIKRHLADRYNVPLASSILGFSLTDLEESDIVNHVDSVEDFKNRQAEEYYSRVREARDLILSGSVCRIELLAGLASRLFGDERSRDTSRSYAAHDVYEVAESVKYDLTKCQDRITGVSMATRIMVQEWIDIERLLLQKYNKTAVDADIIKERKEVVWKTPRVIVINKESGESIIKEFIKNDFFGHNPELVVFVNQPTSKGFDVRSSAASIAEDSLSFPSGHAEATIQVVRPGAAFTIDKSGNVKVRDKSAVDYLMAKAEGRIRLFTESRVNDMIRLGYVMNSKDEVLDPFQTDLDMMALALYRMEKYGEDAIFEQVKQDHKHPTKGGLLFEKNGWTGLVEEITQPSSMLEFAAGALQNRFYLYMTPKALAGMLQNGFPPYLTFRDGYLYVDTVTGDMGYFKTTKAGFIGSADRRLTDYKDSKKPLENGVNAAYRQDTNSVFKARLAELREGAIEDVALDLTNAPGFEPDGVGAIRGKGTGLTGREHGTRTFGNAGYDRDKVLQEESVNGIIARLIRDGDAYAIRQYGNKLDDVGDIEIPEGHPIPVQGEMSSMRLEYMRLLTAIDGSQRINFIVLKGLRKALLEAKIAPDLVFHPGITRHSVYIDEDDLLYLLSLDGGWALINDAINHEEGHINNPFLSEEAIEKEHPTKNLRAALAERDIKVILPGLKKAKTDEEHNALIEELGYTTKNRDTKWLRPSEVSAEKRIVMLISGGESAGVNAYFGLLAMKLAPLGYTVEVVENGLDGLVMPQDEFDKRRIWINKETAERIVHMPGAFRGTARVKLGDDKHPDYMPTAVSNLKDYCNTVVVIGGNDHMFEATKLAEALHDAGAENTAVFALAKSIDYDAPNVYMIGADTAGQAGHDLVLRSAPLPGTNKCMVQQVMGRDMGFLTAASANMRLKDLSGYTEGEKRKMEAIAPTMVILTPEWSVPLSDVVKAVRARMKKYGAATVAVSEGFIVKKEDKLLQKILAANPFLKSRFDSVSIDEQGNLKVTELEIGDFIREALSGELAEELKLADTDFIYENAGYSYRAVEPNALDLAVAENVTTVALGAIFVPALRDEVIKSGGRSVCVPRGVKGVEGVKAQLMPLPTSRGVVNLTDFVIYTEEELIEMGVLGIRPQPETLPEMAQPAYENLATTGKDFRTFIRALNSQAESAMDLKRFNICVVLGDEADNLINMAKDKQREPLSTPDQYVTERTFRTSRFYPSTREASLKDIIEEIHKIYSQSRPNTVNLVISGNLLIKEDDETLVRLAQDNAAIQALIDMAAKPVNGYLKFGKALGSLLALALSIEKNIKIGDIRKNILGESLNNLPIVEESADILPLPASLSPDIFRWSRDSEGHLLVGLEVEMIDHPEMKYRTPHGQYWIPYKGGSNWVVYRGETSQKADLPKGQDLIGRANEWFKTHPIGVLVTTGRRSTGVFEHEYRLEIRTSSELKDEMRVRTASSAAVKQGQFGETKTTSYNVIVEVPLKAMDLNAIDFVERLDRAILAWQNHTLSGHPQKTKVIRWGPAWKAELERHLSQPPRPGSAAVQGGLSISELVAMFKRSEGEFWQERVEAFKDALIKGKPGDIDMLANQNHTLGVRLGIHDLNTEVAKRLPEEIVGEYNDEIARVLATVRLPQGRHYMPGDSATAARDGQMLLQNLSSLSVGESICSFNTGGFQIGATTVEHLRKHPSYPERFEAKARAILGELYDYEGRLFAALRYLEQEGYVRGEERGNVLEFVKITPEIPTALARARELLGQTQYDALRNTLRKYGGSIVTSASGLETELSAIAHQDEMLNQVTLIVAHDTTGLNNGAKEAIQASDKLIEHYLKDSFVAIRAGGDSLVDQVQAAVANLPAGRKYAIVASGKNMTTGTELELLDLIRKANEAMQAVSTGNKPMSAILKFEGDREMTISSLQNLAIKMGFSIDQQEIIDFLNSVAKPIEGDAFTPEAISELLRKGFIVLKPIHPINWNEVDEAHKAEAAVLRSM